MYCRPFDSTSSVRLIVSGKWEFPPSMMMSAVSRSGRRVSMRASTGGPALTSIMTRRGFASDFTSSSSECVPTTFVPFASWARNSSTFDTVRL